ncbi:MAG: hypothetical protein HYT09_03340 [Candidatus Levybacteria bacterium]|nr:hypothetical protein [Candidatus Levybacteria bacterium]
MYTYKKLSVIKGILEVESYGLIIYIFGNLGIRTIGLIGAFLFFVHEKRKNGFFLILLISICLVSLFVPLLFIQSIKVFEITQMTAYFLFISAIIGSFGFAYFFNLLKIKILQIAAFIIILIIALPSAYESFVGFSNVHLIGVKISDPYFESMNYLKSDKNYFSTVLEIPGPFTTSEEKSLNNWYGESSPHISAFGNKRTFLNNEFIDFPGQQLAPRMELLKLTLDLRNATGEEKLLLQRGVKERLRQNKIVYIYSAVQEKNLEETEGIELVFQNSESKIYKFSY